MGLPVDLFINIVWNCGKNGQGATKGGEVRMTLNVSASAWFLKVFHNAYA